MLESPKQPEGSKQSVDFSKLAASLSNHTFAWPFLRGTCAAITALFKNNAVSHEMWDLVSEAAGDTKICGARDLKSMLGHLANCWIKAPFPETVNFFKNCVSQVVDSREFPEIVSAIHYVIDKKPNRETLSMGMGIVSSLLPDFNKARAFLRKMENDLVDGFLNVPKHTEFQLVAIKLMIQGGWNFEATDPLIDDFLEKNPSETDKWLVLRELEATNGKERKKPKLPVVLSVNEDPNLRLILKESYKERESGSKSDYYVSQERSVAFSKELEKSNALLSAEIISQLQVFRGTQSNFPRALDYYSNVIKKFDREVRAENHFDQVLSGKEGYYSHSEILSEKPFLVDQPPWVLGSKQIDQYRGEALMIAAGVKDFSRGFGTFTMAARSLPNGRLPALERFGLDLFDSVQRLNAQDIGKFPGRGWLLSHPRTERFLLKDDLSEIINDDPFIDWKEDWPFLSKEIDIFHKTQILSSRGLFAFANTDSRFNYFGEQYCYVVFNDHFHRQEHQGGYLMPWRIITEAVQPCLVSNIRSDKFAADLDDVNARGLTLEYMMRRCSELKVPFLNLSWASNLGGLCNAFPAESHFYHDWEREVRQSGRFKDWYDLWGHLHKALIDNNWHPNGITKQKEALYRPLRQAHRDVYEMSLSYQNLAHLFKLAFSFWQKGFCDPVRGEVGQPVLFMPPSTEDIVKRDNFLKSYLLREAYRWHNSGIQKQLPKEAFPVLGLCNVFQLSSAPQEGFSLDTHSLTLRWKSGDKSHSYQFNSKAPEEMDEKFWLKKIFPLISSTTIAPNFLHRLTFSDLPQN